MVTSSYLEFYLTLLAWIINNAIWASLVATGIVAMSLGAIVISEWRRARDEGADEGNKGVLSIYRIENRMWIAFIIILFGLVPVAPVQLSQIRLNTAESVRCGVSVAAPNRTPVGRSFQSIGNRTAAIPIWWYLIHAMSKGITAAAVTAIPCTPDVRQVAMEIDATRIEDPILLQEVADFTNDCYGRARHWLFNRQVRLTPEQQDDVNWIGSNYFLRTPGYYDTARSMRPRADWPYTLPRDQALASGRGGYPTCNEWWSDPGRGLRAKIVAQVDPGLMANLVGLMQNHGQAQVQDAMIRDLVSPRNQARTMRPGEIYQEYGANSRELSGSSLLNLGTAVGLGANQPRMYTMMTAVKTALPMVQAFVLLAIVICLPLILTFSTFDLKVLMTATFGIFGIHMLTFWWELARWVDSSLLTALYADVGLGFRIGLTLPTQVFNDAGITHAVMEFVMAALYVILPGVFFAGMTWAGFRAGNGIEGAMSAGSQKAGSAGGDGPSTVGGALPGGAGRAIR